MIRNIREHIKPENMNQLTTTILEVVGDVFVSDGEYDRSDRIEGGDDSRAVVICLGLYTLPIVSIFPYDGHLIVECFTGDVSILFSPTTTLDSSSYSPELDTFYQLESWLDDLTVRKIDQYLICDKRKNQ